MQDVLNNLNRETAELYRTMGWGNYKFGIASFVGHVADFQPTQEDWKLEEEAKRRMEERNDV